MYDSAHIQLHASTVYSIAEMSKMFRAHSRCRLMSLMVLISFIGIASVAWTHPYTLTERDNDAQATIELLHLKPNSTVIQIDPVDERYIKALTKQLNNHATIVVQFTHQTAHSSAMISALTALSTNGPKIIIESHKPLLHHHPLADALILDKVLHRWEATGSTQQNLSNTIRQLTKDGSILIIDYRQDPQRPEEMHAAFGYISERTAIEAAQQAGLEWQSASEINANPHDLRDYDQGAYTLPPTLRLGAKDRDRYNNIGEADRFTLLFKVKNQRNHSTQPIPSDTHSTGNHS